MDEKKKIDSIMEKTAEKLTGLVDVNTVIGKPVVTASGAQVIPFTKVTMGYLSGGGEYGDVKKIEDNECLPFAGGAGTGLRMRRVLLFSGSPWSGGTGYSAKRCGTDSARLSAGVRGRLRRLF